MANCIHLFFSLTASLRNLWQQKRHPFEIDTLPKKAAAIQAVVMSLSERKILIIGERC